MSLIEKKFNMFSTKEWLQYLQYKISPERDKELENHTHFDPFLKEAVDTLCTQENRPLAMQSLTYLISTIQESTGVSESTVTKVEINNYGEPSNFNPKIIIGLGAALLLALLGAGIYYWVSNDKNIVETDDVSLIDTVPIISQSSIDSSSIPMEVIPNTAPSTILVDTIIPSTLNASLKKKVSKPSYSTSSTNDNSTSNISTSSSTSTSSKERDMFNQAQEYVKQNNRDEAKKILNELKSYDNPMKSQSEHILKNMGE